MKAFSLVFGLLLSSSAFAKSGFNIINTDKLYVYVCGKGQYDCADTFVYRNIYYNLGFDFQLNPVLNAKEQSKFHAYLDSQRTEKAQLLGPISAAISIQAKQGNGLKNLVVLSWNKVDGFVD